MFSPRNTESPNPFRPALQYLVSAGRPQSNHRRSSSSGTLDSDGEGSRPRMLPPNPDILYELGAPSFPPMNASQSASPFRSHSDSNSDTDDDDWGYAPSSTRQPFFPPSSSRLTGWRRFIYGGGAGQFFFNTSLGWQIYIGILVLWLGGCQIGLTIMNRIILWSGYLQENYTSHTKLIPLIAGVYKFPYPLTTTLIEMLITHGYLLLSAYITRWVSPWLISAGLSGGVAPLRPLQSPAAGFRGGKDAGFWGRLSRWTAYQTGGIAGGGLFEFDLQVAKTVLPCAVIFLMKLVLSNLSFTYSQLHIYVFTRIFIVPFALFFSYFLGGSQHSASTISSALIATLTLAIAAIPQSSIQLAWDVVSTGVFSSVFVALYPVQLQRTYKALLASLIPQGDLLGSLPSSNPPDFSGSKEEACAYWRLLHYTSLLSILLFTPIVILSGELAIIWRNCYVLDVFFHWLMVLCGGTGSWAVFWSTVALTRATSPLTTAFLFVPRAAFLLPVMARFSMSAYAWIGIALCWASCVMFALGRRKGGRELGRLR